MGVVCVRGSACIARLFRAVPIRTASAIGALGAVVLTGCIDQQTVEPSATSLVVHAVLDMGARDQYVTVQSTVGATATAADVTGANVSIVTPDGKTLTATEERDSTTTTFDKKSFTRSVIVYHIALDKFGVSLVPGGTYRLRAAAPDGRVVTGATTIPGGRATEDSAMAPLSFDHARDSVALAWSRVPGSRSYAVQVHSRLADFMIFADTSITLRGGTKSTTGAQAFTVGVTNQITVSAVDANFYDYYRRGSDGLSGVGLTIHLDGGLGVFGSIVEVRKLSVNVH